MAKISDELKISPKNNTTGQFGAPKSPFNIPFESKEEDVIDLEDKLKDFNIFKPIIFHDINTETKKADEFFDAVPPSLNDIYNSYDIGRTEYNREGGIKKTIQRVMKNNEETLTLLSIKGRTGSGKSTLLKRIIFDFSNQYLIYEFSAQTCRYSLLDSVKQLIQQADKPIIFIFDDAIDLKNYDVVPSNFLNVKIENVQPVLFIFSEQTNQWNYLEKINELRRKSGNKLFEFSLAELDSNELNELVDKIIRIENENKFIKVKSNLTKSRRLQLCGQENNKLIVTILLILRYGKNISTIIEEEYTAIPSKEGKNIYAAICLLAELEINFSTILIRKAFGIRSTAEVQELTKSIEGLVVEENGKYYPRHILLGEPLANSNKTHKLS